jgi:hypothetical protein
MKIIKQENDVIGDNVENCKSIHVEECRSIDWLLVITKPNDPLTKLMEVLVIFFVTSLQQCFFETYSST